MHTSCSIDFSIGRCKTRAAINVKPSKRIKLDLNKIKSAFKTIVDTPILLVIDEGGEIIIQHYGELIFKTHTDEKKIRAIAEKIYKSGL